MDILKVLQDEFNLKGFQVENTVKLIDDGNTIPFIARYRKEMTGALDDQTLRKLNERLTYLRNMDEQREKIISTIEEQGKMTDELKESILNAETLTELEDIYRPYRPKRKTRASVAKEKGLEPLAEFIYSGDCDLSAVTEKAKEFISEEKGVENVDEALQGAKDIIAENISDDADIRKKLRAVFSYNAIICSKAAKEDLGVYEIYGDFSENVRKIPGHRVLAINRGEKERFLKVNIEFDEENALDIVKLNHINNDSFCGELVLQAAQDAYTRLIFPAISRELRNDLTEKASASAIKVFSLNLRQLLMQPPVKNKVTIGLDPGYRTGCKVAVVDGTGKVLDTGVIYPVPPHQKLEEAKKIIKDFVKKYNVDCFAIGNGTASHETEEFAANVIKEIDSNVSYMVVSEAGASVYSASPLAAKEFPDYDVSLRSAVSIARRLQDPLAELVKIDPKAIGVGQYQHDMPQAQLSDALDGVVESCVNEVGVDLNTASAPLLSRIAGINATVANNIVLYREENGVYTSRTALKKVPKLGPKAFEQCAGFLRVDGKEALDNTAVHPESYKAAGELLSLCGYTKDDVKQGKIVDLAEKIKSLGETQIAEKLGIGLPTLKDIASYLSKPGRDPRDDLPKPTFRTDVISMESLKEGMELKGTVRNIIDFGAFVDIGVHQDGLVHISQISDKYIKHPSEVLKVGDIVNVKILSVDIAKKRISLTMKGVN